MRVFLLGLFLCLAVLFPKTGNAQVSQFRIPQADVTAANADWQVNRSPIVVGGLIYDPTSGFREFDGQVMAEVGMFDGGVPIYADTTLEPYSELYVAMGGTRLRAYERRQDGSRGSTSASRVASLPIIRSPDPAPGRSSDAPAMTVSTTHTADRHAATRTVMQSIPPPSTNNGIWLEFDNARWYAVGSATAFSPDRFEPLGEYRGFPVYRDKTSTDGAIWVSVFKDSPAVAPYAKR